MDLSLPDFLYLDFARFVANFVMSYTLLILQAW